MEYLSSFADPRHDREVCQDHASDNSGVKNCCVDWSSVPEDLVSIIANKVIHIKDYTVFSAVCTSWQYVYAQNKGNLIREPLLLMLPTEDDKDGKTRSLYSLYEKKIYDNLKITLPHNLHCRGSSHGWLATVSENYEVRLINPFLPPHTEIQLPPLTTFDCHPKEDPIRNLNLLKKVVLSADPRSNPNYTVMAIHGGYRRLSFFKSGDKAWTPLDNSELKPIVDLIYDQDKFYALHTDGHVFECDVNGPCPKVETTIKTPKIIMHDRFRYLVKSSSDFLQVLRHVEENTSDVDDLEDLKDDNYNTTKFTVYKFDDRKSKNWKLVESLDGKVMFVGDNSSLCLSVSDMPGCKPDCIYYTDDNHDEYLFSNIEPHDMGVFNMEDKSIQPIYPADNKMFLSAPIMIQPSKPMTSPLFS